MSTTSHYLENALMFKEHGIGDEYSEHINDKLTLDIKFAKVDENGNAVDGTTVQDLIAVAIGKLNMLSDVAPNREISLAITKLEEALMWLHYCTVEGTKEK